MHNTDEIDKEHKQVIDEHDWINRQQSTAYKAATNDLTLTDEWSLCPQPDSTSLEQDDEVR